MAEPITRQFEALAPRVAVDPDTGSATITFDTNRERIELSLAADVLLLLQARIDRTLAQERRGGLRILPAVTGFHGLEVGQTQSQLQIRLVLEDGSEARLPIQESALSRLNTVLTKWFAAKEQEDREGFEE